MTSEIAFIDAAVLGYLSEHTTAPSPLEQRLIGETQTMAMAAMQIGHPQARFMGLLTRILQPSLVIEIGTFTGYSTLVIAQELGENSKVIACDISREWTSVAQRYWLEAGVDDSIDLRIAPAIETLANLHPDTRIDMAFIDADKQGYLDYLEALYPMLHPRSVVLVDNTLWDARVVDANDTTESTEALRQFNHAVVNDPRFDVVLLPVGDGLSFITLRR